MSPSTQDPALATQPPFSIDLRISPSTCSLSGNPPFTTTTIYTCTTTRPIWVLVSLFSDVAYHIQVRDKNGTKVGCPGTRMCDDDGPPEHEDAQLVRLSPGGSFERSYTFAVKPKLGGLKHSDVRNMREGAAYHFEMGKQKCWWMYADTMKEDMTEEERREMLLKDGVAVDWKPDREVHFMAVA